MTTDHVAHPSHCQSFVIRLHGLLQTPIAKLVSLHMPTPSSQLGDWHLLLDEWVSRFWEAIKFVVDILDCQKEQILSTFAKSRFAAAAGDDLVLIWHG
jgi:hypothetical protein